MALKLLVVDDDPDVLKVIQSVLTSLGYASLALTESREAVERIDREKFDGILLDARMPSPDGFALAQHIRRSRSNSAVPVVMVTAFADDETVRKGLSAGITFFLTKPLEVRKIDQLLQLMHGPMLRERRRYTRLPLRTRVVCQNGDHQFESESINISEEGMLLGNSAGIHVGQEIKLQFSLPKDSYPISCVSKVVRHADPPVRFPQITRQVDNVGVQFLRQDPESKKAIQEYVAKYVLG